MSETQRKVTKAGRAAMATAGLANLETFRAQQHGSPEELAILADEFAGKLGTDLGENLTAAQVALVLSAKLSYVVLQKAFNKFLKQRRFKRFDATIEALGRTQGTLRRALEGLELLKPDPEVAQQRERDRIAASRPTPEPPKPLTPEEQALADRKARKDKAWRDFMNTGFQGEPPSERDEDY